MTLLAMFFVFAVFLAIVVTIILLPRPVQMWWKVIVICLWSFLLVAVVLGGIIGVLVLKYWTPTDHFYAPLRPGLNDFDIGLLPGSYMVQVYQDYRSHPDVGEPFSLSGYLVVDGQKVVLRPQWIRPDPTGKATEFSEKIVVPRPPANKGPRGTVSIHLNVDPDVKDVVVFIWHPMKMSD